MWQEELYYCPNTCLFFSKNFNDVAKLRAKLLRAKLLRAKFACQGSREIIAGKGLRAKIRMTIRVRKASRVKVLQKAAVKQPIARCITGYWCSICKTDYILAMTMGLHSRLGEGSCVSTLTPELLQMIIEMTKPKRQLPAWMSCSWNVKMQQRRRARAVLESSRTAQRKRGLRNLEAQAIQ